MSAIVPAVIASIPSPSFNAIWLFNIYGLCIALGIIAAVTLSQRRWSAAGGHEDDISTIALWAVPAGIIGARIYHLITDGKLDDGFATIVNIREGGLGIPGGMFAGILAGLWVARRRGIDMRGALDAAVPGLPLAQAIGRWGNWFNQELYGSPTNLPWGLEIDADHRGSIPDEFRSVEEFPTFHPTFLYESLWNLTLVGVLLYIDKKGWLSRGRLIAGYLIGYGVGRWWIEAVRIDSATTLGGFRVNIYMSAALVIGGLVILLWPKPDSASQESTKETASLDS